MRAARLHRYDTTLAGPEYLVLEEVPDPVIREPDEVIVRIEGAGVCRTDLHIVEGQFRDRVPVVLPYIPGHENAGSVAAVGPGVQRFRPGDPVIVYPQITDGTCLACRRGEDMHCENGAFPGLTRDGGFAEYLLTKERNLVRLPDGVSPRAVAPHADAGLTAYHAVKRALSWLKPGDSVALIGFGGLGHIALQVLHALAPVDVLVIDRSETALKLARELGATATIQAQDDPVSELRELTGGRGAAVVLDFVGEGQTPQQGLAMTRRGGAYFVIGYGGRLEVPTIELVDQEKTIVGNLVGTYAELAELMELVADGRIKLSVTYYPLDQVNQALRDLRDGRVKGRAVLVP
ncbi:MAG: NAD(P)-dependent alcohol dehydrogenase [Thermomicrobium sp.]|nr:NAD(P)-dependent alcohol dehydrogenase [Thermomicrobium sp.]MDW8060570.1 NAD(P)-dependent alcohol dehydrogenase [Thermomicrobium sp.]